MLVVLSCCAFYSGLTNLCDELNQHMMRSHAQCKNMSRTSGCCRKPRSDTEFPGNSNVDSGCLGTYLWPVTTITAKPDTDSDYLIPMKATV